MARPLVSRWPSLKLVDADPLGQFISEKLWTWAWRWLPPRRLIHCLKILTELSIAHLAHLNGLAKVHAGRRVRLPQGNEAVGIFLASLDPLRDGQNWTVEELGQLPEGPNVGAGLGQLGQVEAVLTSLGKLFLDEGCPAEACLLVGGRWAELVCSRPPVLRQTCAANHLTCETGNGEQNDEELVGHLVKRTVVWWSSIVSGREVSDFFSSRLLPGA